METDRQDLDCGMLRRRLIEERDGLLAESSATMADRETVTLDQQSVGRLSRISDLQAQAMANAQENRRRTRLQIIDAALKRMAEGEYGYCLSCGEPVPKKRLDADAAAACCTPCAQKKK